MRRRWRSSTRPLTKRWPSRRAISTPTVAGRWHGSSSLALPRASMAWPKRSPRPRTPASAAWSRRVSCRSAGQGATAEARRIARRLGSRGRPASNAWEMLHHLIRVLEHAGEAAAAQLVAKYGIARPKSFGNSRIVSTPSASGKSGRRRPSPTTPSSRAGRRSCGSLRTSAAKGEQQAGRSSIRNSQWPSATTSASAKPSTSSKTDSSPFVEREMKSQHAQLWIEEARGAVSESQSHLFKKRASRSGTPLRSWR